MDSQLRKDCFRLGIVLLLYNIVGYALVWFVAPLLYQHNILTDSSMMDCIANLFGLLLISPFCGNTLRSIPLKKQEQHPQKFFLVLVCCIFACQMLYSLWGNLLEFGLECCGLTALEQQQSAGGETSPTFWYGCYTFFLAPLTEEFLYRGIALQSLKKYGKPFAILLSALLFGFMHGNLFQIPYGICTGLVLGVCCLECSFFHAVLLHIANNFLYGFVLQEILSRLSPTMQDYCNRGISIFFFALSAWILLKHRNCITEYVHEHKQAIPKRKAILCSVTIPLFFLLFTLLALSGIHTLSTTT